MNKNLARKLPAPLVAGAIWLLSSQSTLPHLSAIFGFDKVQHLFAWLVLAAATALWFPPEDARRRPLRTLLFSAAIASAYGAIDEAHQYFVPGRDSSVWDWAADTLGALIGASLPLLYYRLSPGAAGKNRQKSPPDTLPHRS